jgi:hypothetical protein
MAARRFTLRLRQHGRQRREWDTNLDPADDSRLRELLEEGVSAVHGSLKTDLADGWQLVVHSLGGGRIWAKVSVDSSGRTAVKR